MDMTTNWSSPSNFSPHPESHHCTDSRDVLSLFAFHAARYVIILPFALLVLYQGYQCWRQQRSLRAMSQSDFITCHIAAMQLCGVLGITVYICGLYAPLLFSVGGCILTLLVTGELLFNTEICVERYLAVVHPITYRELRNSKGVKIRRFYVGGVWLFSFGWALLVDVFAQNASVIPFFCLVSFCFAVVSFCSLSVLCVLIRPGPGEAAGEKERVDQSKQKAFLAVVVITGALWLSLVGYVVCIALETSKLLSYDETCWMAAAAAWFSLPSSLVVPLLFLHRAGNLRCCCASAG